MGVVNHEGQGLGFSIASDCFVDLILLSCFPALAFISIFRQVTQKKQCSYLKSVFRSLFEGLQSVFESTDAGFNCSRDVTRLTSSGTVNQDMQLGVTRFSEGLRARHCWMDMCCKKSQEECRRFVTSIIWRPGSELIQSLSFANYFWCFLLRSIKISSERGLSHLCLEPGLKSTF